MVIELVVFRIRRDIAEADFLRAASATSTFLSRCEGFIRRRLAKSDTDEWIDYVEWRSMADALTAARGFRESSETRAFNDAIEAGVTVVRHLTVRMTSHQRPRTSENEPVNVKGEAR
jgi:heme-degrading monooxygenase HmoA